MYNFGLRESKEEGSSRRAVQNRTKLDKRKEMRFKDGRPDDGQNVLLTVISQTNWLTSRWSNERD